MTVMLVLLLVEQRAIRGYPFRTTMPTKEPLMRLTLGTQSTPGLTFENSWKKVTIGNDTMTMRTTAPAARATYQFVATLQHRKFFDTQSSLYLTASLGESIAWWGCCMQSGVSSNTAAGAYTIDGGDIVPFQLDEIFMQGSDCIQEKLVSRGVLWEAVTTIWR